MMDLFPINVAAGFRTAYKTTILFTLLAIAGCGTPASLGTASSEASQHDVPGKEHWGYMGIDGPAHWSMLTPAYQTCEAGQRQSPINIEKTHPKMGKDILEFRYANSRLFEVNNGHTIQVSHVSGCEIGLGDQAYPLRQFHFHAPSEHHIHGRAFPMEMHLVHQDASGHIVVVAVLLETGAEAPVLSKLWKWLPNQVDQKVSLPLEINIASILPEHSRHFSYSGSLTTPPCTEGVQWIILEDPVKISEEDVRNFVEIIGYNARPVQPLKEREITEN